MFIRQSHYRTQESLPQPTICLRAGDTCDEDHEERDGRQPSGQRNDGRRDKNETEHTPRVRALAQLHVLPVDAA